ncbi:MAG TPA: pilus assembly PilX N-terminal domain-containing protein [Thermoanaerobaculia bacterium]|nr:pilus assembly PilX N-terminal domain-containing protein [Thermoanaerobaculia bacterium]
MKTSEVPQSAKKMRRRKAASPVALLARLIGLEHEDLPQRGSALLATLMIITGLTLLGLGFVAITSTESAISVNQRNYTQTLQVAEAAALRCVDWFQNPNWALDQQIMPENRVQFKIVRTLFGANVGMYKNDALDILFDRPFRDQNPRHRFYGTENNPDIWINPTTSRNAGNVSFPTNVATDFLTLFNIKLFNNNSTTLTMDNNEGGVVTDIRIYAPSTEGANINASPGWLAANSGQSTNGVGFVEGGTRFGVATIRVTATKYQPACTVFPCTGRVIGTRTVKLAVTEWPFPGPQGPLQTNANLDTSGNIQVHWGRTTAAGDMEMAKTFAGVPWANAYDYAHFEHGYDNNSWPKGFTSTAPRVATGAFEEAHNYLHELVGRALPDPWWDMRARGLIVGSGTTTDPTPFSYAIPSDPTTNRTNWFQLQNQSAFPEQQNMLFPRIDYNFWKQLARSADDQSNIYYLTHAGGQEFRDKAGNVRDVQDWIDVMVNPPAGTGPKSVPGFYFFDTANGLNPQNNGPGTLTPDIVLRGGSMEAKGFWYFNTTSFGTKGINGYNEWINMPGEPYRDIGYWEVEDQTTDANYRNFRKFDPAGAPCNPSTGANCVYASGMIGNKNWDFQDLPFSNNNAGFNQIFDFALGPEHSGATRPSGGTIPLTDGWGLIPFFSGCNPGVTCSEPHEPYLNFIYPTVAGGAVAVNWHDPASLMQTLAGSSRQTRRPKRVDAAGNPVACTAENLAISTAQKIATRADCTGNGYDKDGGLVQVELSFNGVLYNEGIFDSTGNARYFGSVLAQADASKAGTPEIYFDERLVKGAWPPGGFGFPRVYVSSQQTDQ